MQKCKVISPWAIESVSAGLEPAIWALLWPAIESRVFHAWAAHSQLIPGNLHQMAVPAHLDLWNNWKGKFWSISELEFFCVSGWCLWERLSHADISQWNGPWLLRHPLLFLANILGGIDRRENSYHCVQNKEPFIEVKAQLDIRGQNRVGMEGDKAGSGMSSTNHQLSCPLAYPRHHGHLTAVFQYLKGA